MKKTNQIIILFLIVAVIKILINLSTKYLLFLDSWTVYHILDGIINHHEILPRSVLYLYYPLSYLPLLPFSEIFGILFTLKFIYPLITSLAVIPLYYLLSLFIKEQRIFIATLIIVLIDDFLLRSISVTPQGIALIFLFSGMYFLFRGRKGLFMLFGIFTILTHHLTSLILLVFVIARIITLILEYKERNVNKNLLSDLKSIFGIITNEKESLVYSALFLLSWLVISSLTDKNILSIYLLIKLLPLAVLIVFFLLTLRYQIRILNALRAIRTGYLLSASAIGILSLFFFILSYSTHSFISSYSYKVIFLIPVYIIAPIAGMQYLLRNRDRFWLVFYGILLLLFISIIVLKLNCVFDAYRFLPFILLPLVIAIVRERNGLGYLLLFLVIFSSVFHLFLTYNALVYNEKQVDAAIWAKNNLSDATIATDTKMSALFLGLANRPATFEGSFWLFSQDNLAPWIKIFNRYRFINDPIKYIATARYMYETGADISWSAKDYLLTERNIQNYNKIGSIVFNNSDVIIWEINMAGIENSTELLIEHEEKGFIDNIITKFIKNGTSIKEGEITVDSKIAYGTTC